MSEWWPGINCKIFNAMCKRHFILVGHMNIPILNWPEEFLYEVSFMWSTQRTQPPKILPRFLQFYTGPAAKMVPNLPKIFFLEWCPWRIPAQPHPKDVWHVLTPVKIRPCPQPPPSGTCLSFICWKVITFNPLINCKPLNWISRARITA